MDYSEADHKILGRGERLLQMTSKQQEYDQASSVFKWPLTKKGERDNRGTGGKVLLVTLLPSYPVSLIPRFGRRRRNFPLKIIVTALGLGFSA